MSDNKPMSVEAIKDGIYLSKYDTSMELDADLDNLIAAVRAECADKYLVNELDMKWATSRLISKVKANERAIVLAAFRKLAEEWQSPCDDHDCREVTCSTFKAAGNRLANLIQYLETTDQKP